MLSWLWGGISEGEWAQTQTRSRHTHTHQKNEGGTETLKRMGLEMATRRQGILFETFGRSPLPDNSDLDVVPPAAQTPGSRRQCLDKIPNVSIFSL